MRALILSDIHANLEALTAVIGDAETRGGFDALWCLGDLVGYGPDPAACLEMIRRHEFLAVAGNHDYAAVAKSGVERYNSAAKAAIQWTASVLTQPDVDFLADLPTVITEGPFTLVHGSLRNHLEEYLLEEESALATFNLLQSDVCLVGHSHLSFICQENGGAPLFPQFAEDESYQLGEERKIINPGGVGQPRDRDPRPSYALYDSQLQTIVRHRVTYDIHQTQDKMRQANLPQYLVERLSLGT